MATEQDTKERIVAHTPGPWAVVYGTDGHHHIFSEDGPIADVKVRFDADEQEANANLLLAAPDLLVVCRRFLEMYDDVRKSVGPSVLAAIEHAERAIAKAEGRS